jgi:hypothetical protein
MDPDATFAAILERISDEDWTEAAIQATSLKRWLRAGGFAPGSGKIRMTSIHALLNWLIKHSERHSDSAHFKENL